MLDVLTDPYKGTAISDILGRAGLQGRTSGGRFTTPSILNNWEPEDFPPDSVFWKRQANASLDYLRRMLAGDYAQWAELTWPGAAIDSLTWRTIRDMTEAAIDAHQKTHEITQLAEAAHAWLKEKNALHQTE